MCTKFSIYASLIIYYIISMCFKRTLELESQTTWNHHFTDDAQSCVVFIQKCYVNARFPLSSRLSVSLSNFLFDKAKRFNLSPRNKGKEKTARIKESLSLSLSLSSLVDERIVSEIPSWDHQDVFNHSACVINKSIEVQRSDDRYKRTSDGLQWFKYNYRQHD